MGFLKTEIQNKKFLETYYLLIKTQMKHLTPCKQTTKMQILNKDICMNIWSRIRNNELKINGALEKSIVLNFGSHPTLYNCGPKQALNKTSVMGSL